MTSAYDKSSGQNSHPRKRQPSHRRRYQIGNPRRRGVSVLLSQQEYETVAGAAARLNLAVGAYVGQAAMAAATNTEPPQWSPMRDLLLALIQASGQVHRIGVNLNQAVATLNATGTMTSALERYAATAARVTEHLDDVADDVRRKLP